MQQITLEDVKRTISGLELKRLERKDVEKQFEELMKDGSTNKNWLEKRREVQLGQQCDLCMSCGHHQRYCSFVLMAIELFE